MALSCLKWGGSVRPQRGAALYVRFLHLSLPVTIVVGHGSLWRWQNKKWPGSQQTSPSDAVGFRSESTPPAVHLLSYAAPSNRAARRSIPVQSTWRSESPALRAHTPRGGGDRGRNSENSRGRWRTAFAPGIYAAWAERKCAAESALGCVGRRRCETLLRCLWNAGPGTGPGPAHAVATCANAAWKMLRGLRSSPSTPCLAPPAEHKGATGNARGAGARASAGGARAADRRHRDDARGWAILL
jgi:hypothetical protein